MIESVMLVIFGFLAASLVAIVIAPAFHARAVRLTTKRIRDSLPLSEAEMRADKDLMRAEYAVKVHQLEKVIEEAKLNAHRKFIEINRRDQTLKRLKEEAELLTADLEENQNARRVLEQTINDRLPKLEGRLDEARSLLRARDQEIAELGHEAERQAIAYNEARGINAQLQGEVERLQSYLSDLQGRDRRRSGEPGLEAEIALRSELEGLRGKTREQAILIDRLQSAVAAGGGRRSNGHSPAGAGDAVDDTDIAVLRGRIAEQAAEIRRLQSQASAAPPTVASQRLIDLEGRAKEQAEEIERLKSEVELARSVAVGDTGAAVKESKSFLKSRLERLETEIERERKTVMRLRAELASANERAARQAAQFMEEMRRFSSRPQAAPQRSTSSSAAPARAARPSALRPRPQAVEASVLIAAPSGETTVRARELQRTLEASFAPEQGPALAATREPAPAIDAGQPEADAEGDRRPRLLERLRTYEDA